MVETPQQLRERLFDGGSFSTVGVARAREILAELRLPGGARVASIDDAVVPGEPPVPVRLYHPVPGAVVPVLVWVHGGGWTIGDLDTSDGVCRELAARTGHLVVSVDYRLAPEHPYPEPLDDVVTVLRWVVEHAADVGGDRRQLTVAGESSGANLVVGALLTTHLDPAPVAQILVVPVVDLLTDRPSMAKDPDPAMPVRDLLWFGENYLGSGVENDDPRVLPLRADSLAHLPAATVLTAGGDALHDGGCALVVALRADGVPVLHLEYEGARHGFFAAAGDDAGQRALAEVVSALRHGRLPVPGA